MGKSPLEVERGSIQTQGSTIPGVGENQDGN